MRELSCIRRIKVKILVVLLIPGSGPTDRNGNSKEAQGNNYLFLLAQALAENDYAHFGMTGLVSVKAEVL